MAVVPLFAVDRPGLVAGLRLSGVPTGMDAEKMVDDAIESARTFFHRRLKTERVNVILAMPLLENPTTGDGVMRMQARLTEVKVVKLDLMKRLRLLFIDASSKIDIAWNTEGLLRDVSSDQAETIMRWLYSEIESDLIFLGGSSLNEDGFNATTFESDDDPRVPGETAYGTLEDRVMGVLF